MRVLTGDYQLRAPSSREHTTLMQLKAAADERLGCQLVLESEGAEVILQPIGLG
jgi:ferredoxin